MPFEECLSAVDQWASGLLGRAGKRSLTVILLMCGNLSCQSASVPANEAVQSKKRPPNFIVIFCDDLGYGDIGSFGSTKHRTPNIDRMAREGMRLTSFYVTSGVCTPSRSSLLTGCYPRRINLHEDTLAGRDHRGSNGWVLFPGAHKGLHPDEITIAEVLKEQDYATAIVGKWHLGDQPLFLPTRQGFDSYFGIPYSNDMGRWNMNRDYPALPLLRNEEVIETEPDQSSLTRRYTEEAVRFIEDHRDEPFFLYVAHTMPHNPVAASELFAGQSANGGYGDAVEEIDWSTGEIFQALDSLGIDEQTLVVFTSDNGASSRWGGSNAPLSGFKGSTMEGGMRVPFIVRWPGFVPSGRSRDDLASTIDLLPTFSRLASASLPAKRTIDGRDIWPLISGDTQAKSPHDAFFYYYRDQLQAIRVDRWKLHLERQVEIEQGTEMIAPRLYDLKSDVGETTDLMTDHPDVVKRLLALAEQARQDLGDGHREGLNQRPAGYVVNPLTLTE